MTIQKKRYTTVLTIAGSDSSGGAGIQADIKTISALGCYAASIITSLTAQNTQGVQSIEALSKTFVEAQLESVFSDIHIHAVKIGMLHNHDVVDAVYAALKCYQPKYIILDPVMIAKGGASLINDDVITHLSETLFPLVTLLTPNIPEAEKLIGEKIHSQTAMQEYSEKMGKKYQVNVLIKGGHLSESKMSGDVLYSKEDQDCHWFYAEHIETKNTHGTGCTLSSAIASYLAKNYSLVESIELAKSYLTEAIKAGSDFYLGEGQGPLNHLFIE